MATAIRSGVMKESPGEPGAWPAFESIEEGVRDARRAAVAARHAAEDFVDDTTLRIRQHPLRAVGVAAVAGAVVGSLVGFGFGWCTRK